MDPSGQMGQEARARTTLARCPPTGMEAVDAQLDGAARGVRGPLAGPVRTALATPGKRVRPQVTLLAFRACGGEDAALARAAEAAAAVELLHVASLLVDDVLDASPARRGAPAVHVSHGQRQALLAAGWLTARAFRLLSPTDALEHPDGHEDMGRAAEGVEELLSGEALAGELDAEAVDRDRWEAIARAKTGSLFALAASLGARCAGAWTHVPALEAYGYRLGLAFQAGDDRLDLLGDPSRTGKPAGLDAARAAPNLARALGADEALAVAHEHAERATRALEDLPRTPARDVLSSLAWWATEREA